MGVWTNQHGLLCNEPSGLGITSAKMLQEMHRTGGNIKPLLRYVLSAIYSWSVFRRVATFSVGQSGSTWTTWCVRIDLFVTCVLKTVYTRCWCATLIWTATRKWHRCFMACNTIERSTVPIKHERSKYSKTSRPTWSRTCTKSVCASSPCCCITIWVQVEL